MNWKRAFVAGVLGGAVITIVVAFFRATGMQVNLSMMLGTMLGLVPGTGTWIIGFVIHLILSGLIALLYGWGFERVTHRASAGIGLAFSLIHTIIAGFFVGILPAIHPAMPSMISPPGYFMLNAGGMGVFLFVLIHLAYGLIVGAMYGTVRHRRPVAAAHEEPAAAHR